MRTTSIIDIHILSGRTLSGYAMAVNVAAATSGSQTGTVTVSIGSLKSVTLFTEEERRGNGNNHTVKDAVDNYRCDLQGGRGPGAGY